MAPDHHALTDKQFAILKYVARHIDAKGWQPSIRDIGDHFGIASPNGVVCHLKSMRRKGIIFETPTTARAISFNWKKYL